MKILLRIATHLAALAIGFALGIYYLPILTAPDSPPIEALQSTANAAQFSGEFRRELADSDSLHWGEGKLYISDESIAFEGELAPGPDYRLYLSPKFVETEAEFNALKSRMVDVGAVRTFENFMIDLPASVDPANYAAAIVWCESFGQFITATTYQ